MEDFHKKIDAVRNASLKKKASWLEEVQKKTASALNEIASALAKANDGSIKWNGFWSDSIEKALTGARCGFKAVKSKIYNPSSHDDYEVLSHYEIWINE